MYVERSIRLLTQLDDLETHRAPVGRRFGRRVVESLFQLECPGDLALGFGECGDEWCRSRVTELGDREPELLLAGLERVVDLHEQCSDAEVESLLVGGVE